MKKYIKPELFFERFELSQQIAACDYDSENTLNNDLQLCKFTGTSDVLGPMTVFLDNCGLDELSMNVTDVGYCYHNSTDDPVGIFNS